jgi:tRNA-specific 2-thiouridylase
VNVLVAMSGGVDSSVAAALLARDGHHVVGVTMRLWGGESDTGCCSVADVDDARRVADHLGIDHLVFNFTEDFHAHVVDPYVAAHANGTTPNPCVECNRRLKFARLAERADVLGFDAVATGHHARIGRARDRLTLERGADRAKDQSYVVHMLGQEQLARTVFPVGGLTKVEVRRIAGALGLRTAAKPDSQDVCFITSAGGRSDFLGRRIPLRAGRVVDHSGATLGEVPAVELVTVGQRKGLGLPGGGPPRFVLGVDRATATVTVGDAADLLDRTLAVGPPSWVDGPVDGAVLVQTSAHGAPRPAVVAAVADRVEVSWLTPERRVAPGQSVVFYDRTDRYVLGGGTAI